MRSVAYRNWAVQVPRRFESAVVAASKKHGVPANLVAAVLSAESGWNPRVVGDRGTSFGLAQIHVTVFPDVARAQALNPGFAIEWTAGRLGKIWHSSSGDVVGTVMYHNCPVCSLYWRRAHRYGPTALLAAEGAAYVRRVLGPVGGVAAAPRLNRAVTAVFA